MSADATPELNPADLEYIPWPPEPKHGMLIGQIPRGMLILHKPTGIAVARTDDRNQHRNKAAAMAELTKLVGFVQPDPEPAKFRRGDSDRSSIAETVRALRALEQDHTPDGYPAVTMRQISQVLDSLRFYQRRCEALQACQSQMRDPERTMVCDILANGDLLRGQLAKNRYSLP